MIQETNHGMSLKYVWTSMLFCFTTLENISSKFSERMDLQMSNVMTKPAFAYLNTNAQISGAVAS